MSDTPNIDAGGFGLLIGYGEDAHRLQNALPLWLGGTKITSDHGAVAHSDGDALLHALSDALLSAISKGDIGEMFPDIDPRWQGLEGWLMVEAVLSEVAEKGYRPQQVSTVVILDRPKLGPYRAEMQANLARLLNLPPSLVGITFKTSEGIAPTHVQARVMVLLRPR